MGRGWKVVGYNIATEQFYYIEGEYPDEETAQSVAEGLLKTIEDFQPSDLSGGQGELGTQDRVFIIKPDGNMYQYLPTSFPPPLHLY
jgi:predicted proteasome-type protease